MSEREFLEYVLEQLLTGQRHPFVRLTKEALEAIEEERIGDHCLQYPFLY